MKVVIARRGPKATDEAIPIWSVFQNREPEAIYESVPDTPIFRVPIILM